MESPPRVSIVIPTRNRASLLWRSVRSALRQTVWNTEVLICDHGSTDDTPEVTRNLAAADPRVRYVLAPAPGGPGVPRNSGLAAARAPFIAFLDDDDEWTNCEHLAQCLDLLEKGGIDVVFTNWSVKAGDRVLVEDGFALHTVRPRLATEVPRDCKGCVIRDDMVEALLKENFIHLPTIVTRRATAHAIGGFEPDLRVGEVRYFLIRLALQGARFGYLATRHCAIHVHASNTYEANPDRLWLVRESRKSWEKLRALPQLARYERVIRANLARSHFDEGYWSFRSGDFRTARRAYLKSLGCRPTLLSLKGLLLLTLLPKSFLGWWIRSTGSAAP